MKLAKNIWVLFVIVLLATGWITVDNRYFKPRPVKFIIPRGWPQPAYDFSKNPLTEEGFALGKKLFYDKRMSADGTMSCGTCHQPSNFFTDKMPTAITNQNGDFQKRNTPTLLNTALQPAYFYDLSALTLENQIDHVMSNPK